MNAQRFFIILLVVLALVFLLLTFGTGGNNSRTVPNWTKSLGSLANPFSPQLDLQTKTFTVAAQSSSQPARVSSSRQAFRKASFELVSGNRAFVVYQNKASLDWPACRPTPDQDSDDVDPDELKSKMKDQSVELRRNRSAELVVLEEGGAIRVDCCQPSGSCIVELR